jgi:hypothetical protein
LRSAGPQRALDTVETRGHQLGPHGAGAVTQSDHGRHARRPEPGLRHGRFVSRPGRQAGCHALQAASRASAALRSPPGRPAGALDPAFRSWRGAAMEAMAEHRFVSRNAAVVPAGSTVAGSACWEPGRSGPCSSPAVPSPASGRVSAERRSFEVGQDRHLSELLCDRFVFDGERPGLEPREIIELARSSIPNRPPVWPATPSPHRPPRAHRRRGPRAGLTIRRVGVIVGMGCRPVRGVLGRGGG